MHRPTASAIGHILRNMGDFKRRTRRRHGLVEILIRRLKQKNKLESMRSLIGANSRVRNSKRE
jgi:hypothetical protein